MAETTNLNTLFKQGYTKARGLRKNYNVTKYENIIYFCTDTQEILVNGKNYGGDLDDIKELIKENKDEQYTVDDADTIIKIKHTGNTDFQLVYTPLSPYDLPVPETIGDIEKGMTCEELRHMPLSKILDDIIFKTIYPTITKPSCTLTTTGIPTSLISAGSQPIYTGYDYTYSRGTSVVDTGAQQKSQPYAGVDTDAKFTIKYSGYSANANAGIEAKTAETYTNCKITTEASTSSKHEYQDDIQTTIVRYEPGTYTSSVIVSYAEGDIFVTSKGAKYTDETETKSRTANLGIIANPIPAGTVSANGKDIKVTLPVYADLKQQNTNRTDNDDLILDAFALQEWGEMTFTTEMKGTDPETPLIIVTPRKLKSLNSYNEFTREYDIQQLTQMSAPIESERDVNGKKYKYFIYKWIGGQLGQVGIQIKTY